jgi:hypothetical protein
MVMIGIGGKYAYVVIGTAARDHVWILFGVGSWHAAAEQHGFAWSRICSSLSGVLITHQAKRSPLD